MSNPVGQSRAKRPGPPQQWHVSGACLAHWASMSMGTPGGRACCWKGRGGGRGGWAEVGMGVGCGATFREKVPVVKPVTAAGVAAWRRAPAE
jgi:hypothetical protein